MFKTYIGNMKHPYVCLPTTQRAIYSLIHEIWFEYFFEDLERAQKILNFVEQYKFSMNGYYQSRHTKIVLQYKFEAPGA